MTLSVFCCNSRRDLIYSVHELAPQYRPVAGKTLHWCRGQALFAHAEHRSAHRASGI